MKEINAYVEKAFEGIPNSQRKSEITQEIIERLEDSAAELERGGKEREDAVNKAIVDFGNLDEILQELRNGTNGERNSSSLWFAVTGSLLIIALTTFINCYYSPGVFWFMYPAFAVIWWPISIFFFGSWRKRR
jgi:hypothetical protein